MADIISKVPPELAKSLLDMVAAGKPATKVRDFLYDNMTAEEAKAHGFSRSKLYSVLLENRRNPQPDPPPVVSPDSKPSVPITDDSESSASKVAAGPVPAPPPVDPHHSDDSLPASSDESDGSPGLDLEYAHINIPELQGMILKKESFKALRRLIVANNRPRKAMSAAKMHLPSRLARADKTLESCVDQVYLAIAALEGGQTDVARVLLNNMAGNLEVERRNAIAEALGVEDAATDISRDGRTDLFSFEERERLPSFREKQQKSRKSQP